MSNFRFGHLNQHEVGSIFKDRKALSHAGIHGPTQAGIWGREKEGACSIVLSGGYEDVDELDYIIYIGEKRRGSKQETDQEFENGNLALKLSYENKLPIRVTRGYQIENGPQNYKECRYDGIYYINHIERVRGKSGYFICRFHLQSENSRENLEKILADKFKPDRLKNFEVSDSEATVKTRGIYQKIFREDIVLPNYNYQCAVTGIKTPSLLRAAHIIRWADDKKERMNPRNGICLSVLADACFENGFITIDSDYTVRISDKAKNDPALYDEISKYDGVKINLPKVEENRPAKRFLLEHQNRNS